MGGRAGRGRRHSADVVIHDRLLEQGSRFDETLFLFSAQSAVSVGVRVIVRDRATMWLRARRSRLFAQRNDAGWSKEHLRRIHEVFK